MSCRNSRWKRGFQNFAQWRNIIFGDPPAQLEDLWPQQWRTIDDAGYRMNFDIRRFITGADDKALDLSFSEWHENARARLSLFLRLIDKRSRQRQAHRHGDIQR